MTNYYFGFSLKGLIIFLLPMIPNIFYFLNPAMAASLNNVNGHLILDVLEHGNQAIFIILLIFLIRKQESFTLYPYVIGIAALLILYYILWIFCFTGKSNLFILLGMAVIPVAYFVLAEFWLNNYLAIIPTAIFGIVHVIITYIDFH